MNDHLSGSFHLQTAARVVRHGGIIAYPTEAVYGLGCDPLNEQAVVRLLAIKQRSASKGLILLAADLDQLLPFVQLTAAQHKQLAEQWPAGVSYLLPATTAVPEWIRGIHTKVAVRVSAHPVASALIRLCGTPLVSTSANRASGIAARNPFQVGRQLGRELDFIVTGQCDLAVRPSTIVDLETGHIIRP